MRGLIRGVICLALIWGIPASAGAQRRTLGMLSPARLGKLCAASKDANAALTCWLNAHPDVSKAMVYADSEGGGSWPAWPPTAKAEFFRHFNTLVEWYANGMPRKYPVLFDTPIEVQTTTVSDFDRWIPEAQGRTVMTALVANNLAAELTGAFSWSIAGYEYEQLRQLLSAEFLFGCYASYRPQPGFYYSGSTLASPASPGYTVTFLKSNGILGATARDTIAGLFAWARILTHTFVESETELLPDWRTVNDAYLWGPNTPPIPTSKLIEGTMYTGPTPRFGHFTNGCKGTSHFFRAVLQAVNIPVETRMPVCQHSITAFPTVGLMLSHGDDPYDYLGWVTPYPGFATPKPTEHLLPLELYDTLFGDVALCDAKTGIGPQMIAVKYLSDRLMIDYCQDVKAGTTHLDSKVFAQVASFYPELDPATLLQNLEGTQLWERLALKATATSFCGK